MNEYTRRDVIVTSLALAIGTITKPISAITKRDHKMIDTLSDEPAKYFNTLNVGDNMILVVPQYNSKFRYYKDERVWFVILDDNGNYKSGLYESAKIINITKSIVGNVALDHNLLHNMGFKDTQKDSNISCGGRFVIWFSKRYGEKAWGDNIEVDIITICKEKAPKE